MTNAAVRMTDWATMISVVMDAMTRIYNMQLEAMCLDCERMWNPDTHQPPHCICDDPVDDAWTLFIRDNGGKWVKALAEAVDNRYNPIQKVER